MKTQIVKLGILLTLAGLLGCSHTDDPNLVAPLKTMGAVQQSIPGSEDVVFQPKVDILFAVDDSTSFDVYQNKLASNIDKFLNAFKSMGQIDFHIGVISNYDSVNYAQREQSRKYQPPAGMLRPVKHDGDPKMCQAVPGGPNYITRNTPNYVEAVRDTIKIGTCEIYQGGTENEEVFTAIRGALSEPMLDSQTNSGFLRPDAQLFIVIITDSDDKSNLNVNSPLEAAELHDYLTHVVKQNPNMVSYYGVLAYYNNPKCFTKEEDSGPPNRIEQLIKMQAGYDPNDPPIMSLCSDDYGTKLAEIGKKLQKKIVAAQNVITLAADPVMNDSSNPMRVTYGAEGSPVSSRQVIPASLSVDPSTGKTVPYDQGWSYDASTHQITIHSGVQLTALPEGLVGHIFVNYQPVNPKAKQVPLSQNPTHGF